MWTRNSITKIRESWGLRDIRKKNYSKLLCHKPEISGHISPRTPYLLAFTGNNAFLKKHDADGRNGSLQKHPISSPIRTMPFSGYRTIGWNTSPSNKTTLASFQYRNRCRDILRRGKCLFPSTFIPSGVRWMHRWKEITVDVLYILDIVYPNS